MIKQIQYGLMILCVIFLCDPTMAKSKAQSLDGIVAVVNDVIITQSELDQASAAIKSQMMSANVPVPAIDALHKQVLEQMINRKLQLQAAEQAGIHVNDGQVDKAISSIASNNRVSTNELYEKVTSQGMSKENYRKEIREEIALQQIEQQEIGSKISMTPEEVKTFMHSKAWQAAMPTASKEYYLEDIIVLLPETANATDIATAKQQANALLAKAKQGTSFKDIGTAEANNKSVEETDLGWRKLSEIPSAFANPIVYMKKGDVLAPIQTANGFHIIRLADVREEKASENNSAAPTEQEAKQMVYQKKMEAAVKKWVARLRTQAVINMHPDA
jgi:peptidyl-prolyl cis-trans isomerase SurA